MTDPISPADIAYAKSKYIPPEVIDAANELIAINFSNGTSKFKLNELKDLDRTKFTSAQDLKSEWFNIEELYRAQGWSVEFDSPAYNESYNSFFVFEAKK